MKPALALPADLRGRLAEQALAAYPREACGLLIGTRAGERAEVRCVHAARNREVLRAGERFDLDPADHLAAEERARALGLAVVGVWHSHPDRPALPSARDRSQAWHAWSYVIVSVTPRGAGELRSWRLAAARFEEEDVIELRHAGSARRAPRLPSLRGR